MNSIWSSPFQVADTQDFHHADSLHSFTHVVVTTIARYPHLPEIINILLPHSMNRQEACNHALRVGYRTVNGFLDSKQIFYENIA
jgi:hypothetical protein